MKANEVMRMGRRRMRAASTAASRTERPLWRNCSANSTIRIPFLLASPMSITNPIWQYTSFNCPRADCAISAPIMAMGTLSRMMKGRMKLSYCAESVRYTSNKPSPNSKADWPPDLRPYQDTQQDRHDGIEKHPSPGFPPPTPEDSWGKCAQMGREAKGGGERARSRLPLASRVRRGAHPDASRRARVHRRLV